MKKRLMLILALMLLFMVHPSFAKAEDWYFKPSKNNQPATTEPEYEALLKKYNGVYIGDTSKKIIYLTFDNGYEAGYTDKILDILKEKHVPAAFFITGHYIEDQPKIVERMYKEGHIIGNHSWGHPDLSKISDKKYKKELDKLEKAYVKLTGDKGMIYLRPPRGTFSERSLKLADEMGYTSVFWSFAYKDWVRDEQKGGDYAYKSIMKRVHPGAILLLHTVSKDNADALGRVIDDLKKQGYTFQSLDYLMAHKTMPSYIW
ncbi:delta-lactam-biosynthetic de-N-acetylase [Scopulibacillus cellulosilyticus]|uniref:Delta-lactam-biosynthetic de-N-acetylase n=1 Tax=Scopulibacillus cellulosilyticus TaxID=2665665 RepID=A0ABW2PX00_9BACL